MNVRCLWLKKDKSRHCNFLTNWSSIWWLERFRIKGPIWIYNGISSNFPATVMQVEKYLFISLIMIACMCVWFWSLLWSYDCKHTYSGETVMQHEFQSNKFPDCCFNGTQCPLVVTVTPNILSTFLILMEIPFKVFFLCVCKCISLWRLEWSIRMISGLSKPKCLDKLDNVKSPIIV